MKQRIVILGSYGEFTRRVAAGLVAMPAVDVVLGLPPAAQATSFAGRIGVPFMVIDPNDPSALQRLLQGAFAVVNLRGPFATRDHLATATRCAALGVHYVDPSDSREYLGEFTKLARDAREHEALLVTGAGAAPAVTAVLAGLLIGEFERASEIHVFVTPGLDDQRELAIARSILDRTEDPLRIKKRGRWQEEHWWTRPEMVRFPPPVGRRRGWLCDLPDLELMVRQFDVGTVTARAGFAPGLLSFVIALLAAQRRAGSVRHLSPMTARLVRLAARLSRAHGEAGAIRVAVRGLSRRHIEEEHVVYLVARAGTGPAIAAAPILALVRKWVEHGVPETGALPCVGMLSLDDIRPELADHNIVLIRE